jgi:glycosyltransferase involved in cell wall biosynthesis
MKQFQNNRKPSQDGKVRIVYMGGSSHLPDFEQLRGVFNVLNSNYQTKDKFKIILAGWDSKGTTTDISFNKEFGEELKRLGLLTKNNIQLLNKSKGNVDVIPKLPKSIADKYRDNVYIVNQRNINTNESVYFQYEKILTDNHRIISDKNYLNWLMTFQINGVYPYEDNFGRRWTQKPNAYGSVLDEADIVIAPLDDNKFNRYKSNLKQVECWTRKLPIVCSGIPPYTIEGKHMENCVLIPPAKNSYSDWQKYLKKLILDEELRNKLGQQLYDDFKEKYNLKNVTNKRADFYRNIVKK